MTLDKMSGSGCVLSKEDKIHCTNLAATPIIPKYLFEIL